MPSQPHPYRARETGEGTLGTPFGDLLLERGWNPTSGFAAGSTALPTAARQGVQPQTVRERAECSWQQSEALRGEFGGNFASFLALCKAEERGLVRRHRGSVVSLTADVIAEARRAAAR
jgi:hypothetical protein